MELKFIDYINLSMGEHEALLNIRNSDYVRLEGLNTNVIAIKEHLQWVASLIKNKEKKYYAVTLDGEIVGGINLFDVSHNQAHWGLFFRANINPLVPSISAYLLFDKVFLEMNLERLLLEVKCDNLNACKFDMNFGFTVIKQFELDGGQYYKMLQTRREWLINKDKPILAFISKKIQGITYQFIEEKEEL